MLVLSLGISAGLFWGFWTYTAAAVVDVARPYRVLWGPPAVALVLLATLRYNTLQGFASYSQTDCLLLLGAPVPRHDLVIMRLRRIAVAMAVAGTVIGGLAALASRGMSLGGVQLVEALVTGAAAGVVVVTAGWQVQRLPRLSVWVTRLTIPVLAIVAALALAGRHGGTAALVASVSGPWGWAVLPFRASQPDWTVVGPVLMVVLAVLGWLGVRRTAGQASLESFGLRAQVRSHAVASLWAMDTRSLLLAGRRTSGGARRSRLSLRMPRRPVLAVCWHGLLLLLRSPMRLGWAVVAAAGGAMVLGMHPGRTGTSWAGALLLYLSASALVEPIRVETDAPGTAVILLPWGMGLVLRLHCVVPAAVMLGAAIVGLVIGLATGVVALGTAPGLIMLLVLATAVQVLSAALSAKRGGRLPHQMLLAGAGDTTGLSVLTIAGWIFGWVIVGVVAIAVATTLTLGRAAGSGQATVTAGILLVALAAILWQRLGTIKQPGEKEKNIFGM